MPAADTFTWNVPDEPLNDESSTASLGSVSVKPESVLLPPLPVDRHLPDSVPGTAGAANDTLCTEPAARSNSLLIRVGAEVGVSASERLRRPRRVWTTAQQFPEPRRRQSEEEDGFLHLTTLCAVLHWRASR